MNSALIIGGAGFIGSSLADKLVSEGWKVTVVDNFDPFYPASVKVNNIRHQRSCSKYELVQADIRDYASLHNNITTQPDVIVHLAAKAGVRPSIADPLAYQEVNVKGTQNVLEFAKSRGIRQFIFASSSSVYGVNPNVPWSETNQALKPISPYASTKVSGELLGHVYSHLYGIRFIALRFFTVYGPRQRPDLAIAKFAGQILEGKPITVFGDGSTRRDYTYIDDITAGIRASMDYTGSNFEVINLGNNHTVSLADLILALEETLGLSANIDRQPEQPGDVPQTWADISKARTLLGYYPQTELRVGLKRFAQWLRNSRAESSPRSEEVRIGESADTVAVRSPTFSLPADVTY